MRLAMIGMVAAACGGAGGDGDGDARPPGDPCGFGSDELLPYTAGNHWTFTATDLSTGVRETKHQELLLDGDDLYQESRRARSTTRSLVRKWDGRVERLRQDKLDLSDTLVETTTYDPPQLRLDESAGRVEPGAAWDEVYSRVVFDPVLGEIESERHERWEVLASEPCETPLGMVDCVRVRRTRDEGGTAVKEFTFGRGIGKVEESGGRRVEQLIDCWRE